MLSTLANLSPSKQLINFFTRERLVFKKPLREPVQLLLVCCKDAARVRLTSLHVRLDLGFDGFARRRRKIFEFAAVVEQGPEALAHAIFRHHVARSLRRLLKVGRCSGGHVIVPKNKLLSHASAHAHIDMC